MIERIHNAGEADPDAGCGNPELSQNPISEMCTSGYYNKILTPQLVMSEQLLHRC